MSSSAGGRKPPLRPPVGGSASRATPFEPTNDNAARRAPSGPPSKGVGERRPDEPGMLEMVPLSSNQDKAEAEADPSATAFFAIPAPKAERSRAAPSAPPPSMGGGPIGVMPPGQPSPLSVSAPPPMSRPPIGMSGSMPPPPMAPQPMVQGPVVQYGGAQPASPFQVAGPGPAAATGDAGSRVQSNRVYAIILAVFMLVGLAVVAAIWFQRDKTEEPKEVVTAPPPPKPVVADPKPVPDTGAAPAPTPKPQPKSTKPKTTTPKVAAPASGPATLSVKLADGAVATAIEVTCPSGFRQRSTLSGGSGSVASVPQEKCTLIFKGGAPAQYGPVHGGQSLKCSIVGTTAVCN